MFLNLFLKKIRNNFYRNYWQKKLGRAIVKQNFKSYIDKLVSLLSESIRDKEMEFMGIPLQVRMVAEVFQKDVEELYRSNQEPSLPKDFDILSLYKLFISSKYEIYFKEKIRIGTDLSEVQKDFFTESFINIHRRLALRVLFPEIEKDFIGDKLESIPESKKQELKSVGIVQTTNNDEITFIHRTFAEYFVGDLLSNMLKTKKESEFELEFLIDQIFKDSNEVVRVFLDYQLAKGIHINILKEKI